MRVIEVVETGRSLSAARTPIPSELVLPLAGFTASRGTFSVPGAIAWTTLGSLVGAMLLYVVGAGFGATRTRAVALHLPLIKASDIDRTEAWFARHGAKAVFFGRLVPLFRSFISLPAGVERMRPATFVALTGLGSFVWNTAFVLAGYLLGESWWIVERYVGMYSKAVIAAAVLAVGYFVFWRLIAVRRGRNGSGSGDPGPR